MKLLEFLTLYKMSVIVYDILGVYPIKLDYALLCDGEFVTRILRLQEGF